MPILFADDTNIFLSGKSMSEMIKEMNVELCKIVEWLKANKLSLNISKTHYTIFKSRRSTVISEDALSINGKTINEVEHTKFLGVTIDSKLTWDKHISILKSKISRGIGILYKARCSLSISSLVTLYYSLIYSHFTYCIEVWGSATGTLLNSLIKIQKKAIRIILSAPFRAPSKPLFQELKMLTLPQIYLNSILLFVFKFLKGLLPAIFDDFYYRNRHVTERATRQDDLLYVPICNTNLFQNTIRIKGVREWNIKEHLLYENCSHHTFKRKLKETFLSGAI
jgi:hypothetical protein